MRTTDTTPAKRRADIQARLCLLGIASEVIHDDVGNERFILTRGHITLSATPGEVLNLLEQEEVHA